MTARYDWTINQGETSTLVYTRFQSDGTTAQNFLQDSTFRMQAKDKFGGTTVLSLTTNGTTEASHFKHTLAAGASHTVTITIPATLTAEIDAPGKYVYDMENVTQDGVTVERVLEGTLIVTPEVTT